VAGAQEGLVPPSLEWVFRIVCWCNAAKRLKFRFFYLQECVRFRERDQCRVLFKRVRLPVSA